MCNNVPRQQVTSNYGDKLHIIAQLDNNQAKYDYGKNNIVSVYIFKPFLFALKVKCPV